MNKRILGIIIGFVISINAISADSIEEDPKDIFYTGLAMRIQKTGIFHINMVHLSESYPDTIYGKFASGYLSQTKQNYKECIKNLESVTKSKPISDFRLVNEAYFYMGICNYDLGNFDLAIKDYTKSISTDNKNSSTENFLNSILERAKTYNRIRKYDLAKNDISAAIQKIENEPQYDKYYNLEQLHVDRIALNTTLNNHKDSILDCDWLINNSKEKKDIGYLYRGQIKYKLLKDYDSGFADYKKAFEINPNNFAAIANIIEVLNARKEYEEIPSYLTHALKIKPNLGVLYYSRGYFLEQLKNRKEACNDMTESLKYSSQNVDRDSEGFYNFDHIPSARSFINSLCK
ncbi:tetratricopeptide repeat protein [Leptospira mtsangambouensis]|uniref:Tetratricopeptide repeat protein n=1 Tax=Leptospira mtsangambouensis TaxID=2484912 RepID=A0ABY2NYZ4_9LEPT|nr:tetratricopeptide repeat protein [Leptospira mtsangambouensis]TGM74284.1 tetratricopeptide repeat protein [Leptospira mtsangambouensis]